jgi:predicted Zn-dependent protease
MFLSPDEAKRIADGLLARSKAEHCIVGITGREDTNLRFARGNATTNGAQSTLEVRIESYFGKRSGAASISARDERMLAQAVTRSEDIARSAPENPETLPPLGPQKYAAGAGYDAPTAAIHAGDLATASKAVIDAANKRSIDVTGYGIAGRQFDALATSAGLFAYEPRTSTEFTVTARNRAGTWSGWAGVAETRIGRLDTARLGARAVDKAAYTAPPVRLDSGKYTVILEPSAVADFVTYVLWYVNARPADEGRSFFSKKGGGNKVGEKLFADEVTIFSDSSDPTTPAATFDAEGVPQGRTVWVEDGVLKNLVYSRYWAQQKGRAPVPPARSFVMAGGTTSTDDMIRDVKRGVLVTRLWYIRVLDREKLVLTGLTRDGNFLIENGRIVGPALNFRFNESPVAILANVLAVGPSERTRGGETERPTVAAPTLLVKDFTFSSPSDAI